MRNIAYGVLRERLPHIYRARVSHLQQVTLQSAETLVEEVMWLIRTPSALHESAVTPLWLNRTTDGGYSSGNVPVTTWWRA